VQSIRSECLDHNVALINIERLGVALTLRLAELSKRTEQG
jgi:hypothetical protein